MMARNMLVSSNQVVTPKVAAHQVTGTVKPYLSAYFERNLLFSVGVTIAVLVVAPLIGYYFIGHFDPVLQAAIVIVSAGWLLNMIVAPLYYAAIGMGKLSIIIMVHFIQSLTIVAALAIPLNLLNPYLPYIVPSASLGIAAFFILAMFNNVLALPDKKTGYTSMLFVLLVSILFFYSAVNLSFAKNLLVAGAVGLTAIAGLLFNPTIRSYFSGIMSKNNTGS